jgi:hypothetical protein
MRRDTTWAQAASLLMSLALGFTSAAAATTIVTAASDGKPCAYQDLMPAYNSFAAKTADLAPQPRAHAFVKDIVPRYPDYYLTDVFGDEAKLEARALRFFDPKARAAVFPGAPPVSDERLAAMGKAVGPRFIRQQRRFMKTFADFHCDTEVEFGVSLLKFDGHPTESDGRKYLLFGVEVIAMLHEPADMPAFFDHELFHLYHRQVAGAEAPHDNEPAWWTMWMEGLATYVSQRMNPGLDAQHVLWFPRDIVQRMDAQRARAAGLMLRDIDKADMDGARWFLVSKSVEGLPERAGYYLGYLFAKSVGDGKPLTELARMPPAQVHDQVMSFLTQLANPDRSSRKMLR